MINLDVKQDYISGNVTQANILYAKELNMLYSEINSILIAEGIAVDTTKINQLNEAIDHKITTSLTGLTTNFYPKNETYSKTEIDNKNNLKANANNVYPKNETYSKTESDNKFANINGDENNIFKAKTPLNLNDVATKEYVDANSVGAVSIPTIMDTRIIDVASLSMSDTSNGFSVGTVIYDDRGFAPTMTITGGADASKFSIDDKGIIRTTVNEDQYTNVTGVYKFDVKIETIKGSDTASISVVLRRGNDHPVLKPYQMTTKEYVDNKIATKTPTIQGRLIVSAGKNFGANEDLNVVVGNISFDSKGETPTFTTSGANASLFEISTSGAIKTKNTLNTYNYNQEYPFNITITTPKGTATNEVIIYFTNIYQDLTPTEDHHIVNKKYFEDNSGGDKSHTTAPTATDDKSTGNVVGDPWIDTSKIPRVGYICMDNTVGSAKWYKLNSGSTYLQAVIGTGLGTVTTLNGGDEYAVSFPITKDSSDFSLMSGIVVVNRSGLYNLSTNLLATGSTTGLFTGYISKNANLVSDLVNDNDKILQTIVGGSGSSGYTNLVRLEKNDYIKLIISNGTGTQFDVQFWERSCSISLSLINEEG